MTRLMTIPDAAQAVGVGKERIREWIASGELRAINASRKRTSKKPRFLIAEADLAAFLESRATAK